MIELVEVHVCRFGQVMERFSVKAETVKDLQKRMAELEKRYPHADEILFDGEEICIIF